VTVRPTEAFHAKLLHAVGGAGWREGNAVSGCSFEDGILGAVLRKDGGVPWDREDDIVDGEAFGSGDVAGSAVRPEHDVPLDSGGEDW